MKFETIFAWLEKCTKDDKTVATLSELLTSDIVKPLNKIDVAAIFDHWLDKRWQSVKPASPIVPQLKISPDSKTPCYDPYLVFSQHADLARITRRRANQQVKNKNGLLTKLLKHRNYVREWKAFLEKYKDKAELSHELLKLKYERTFPEAKGDEVEKDKATTCSASLSTDEGYDDDDDQCSDDGVYRFQRSNSNIRYHKVRALNDEVDREYSN